MKTPYVSLCIPTYNRASYLKKSIDTIICQTEFKSGEVEIVISDNASSDETEKIGREYADRFENIWYFHNEQNIANENFPLVLSRAHGILRRLCNDTLCFREGSLRCMCDVVRRYRDSKPYLCWREKNGRTRYEEKNFREGVLRVSYWMTSIASFSIWDTECQGIAEETAGADLMLWQVRKTLELSSQKNRMVLINENLTYTPVIRGKDVSYGLYHVFYENYFKLLEPYFISGQLSQEDRGVLERDLFLKFFPSWCARWKIGQASLKYSATEDLCECVFREVADKPYRNVFMLQYKKLCIEEQMRKLAKAVLGKVRREEQRTDNCK